MSRSLIHCIHQGTPKWGLQFGQKLAFLDTSAKTTSEVLEFHWVEIWSVKESDAKVRIDEVQLLSPVTQNQQLICQGVNYKNHVEESGLKLSDFKFNTIFTKASSSITMRFTEIINPEDQLALWRLISDKVWSAFGQTALQPNDTTVRQPVAPATPMCIGNGHFALCKRHWGNG